MIILYTGDRGFIAGYTVKKLLDEGHLVVGIDNGSKYGDVKKSYDGHKNYHRFHGDASDSSMLKKIVQAYKPDQIVANAALIGGIKYFHTNAYDIIAQNEAITKATFDAAIYAHENYGLQKINVISSSMVFESHPIPYNDYEPVKLVPESTYGFQKLATEYFAKGAHQQYGLPYTIIRPFNCVGVGEYDAIVSDENAQMAVSHVVPDLVRKVLLGQYPIQVLGDGDQVRCYTYGGDIAAGIYACMVHPNALNDVFNISTPEPTTVLKLLYLIWLLCGNEPEKLRVEHIEPFEHDVQKRIPCTEKASKVLGFQAHTPLAYSVEEVIQWMREHLNK